MRYVGGKARISKWVAGEILPLVTGDDQRLNRTKYLEPFVGSGAIFEQLAPHFQCSTAADLHLDLILMWQALQAGWNPPEHVTREEYARLRDSEPSALRGLVGYGSSFGGKWFGGYVDTTWDSHWQRYTKPYLAAARTSVIRAATAFQPATIVHADYREHEVDEQMVVYCDPPYDGTLGYDANPEPFNSPEFWAVASQWSETGALVIVSESFAPDDWTPIATRYRKAMLRVSVDESNEMREESLWVKRWDYGGQNMPLDFLQHCR